MYCGRGLFISDFVGEEVVRGVRGGCIISYWRSSLLLRSWMLKFIMFLVPKTPWSIGMLSGAFSNLICFVGDSMPDC